MFIQKGQLLSALQDLSTFSGKKPVDFGIKLVRMRRELKDYYDVWNSEELQPALDAYRKAHEVTEVPIHDFISSHREIFEETVEIPITPIPLSSLPSTLEVDDLALERLIVVGIVEDTDA